MFFSCVFVTRVDKALCRLTGKMVNGIDFDKQVPHIGNDVDASIFFGGSSHQARGAYNNQRAAHDRCSGPLHRKHLQVCAIRRSTEIHTSTIAPMNYYDVVQFTSSIQDIGRSDILTQTLVTQTLDPMLCGQCASMLTRAVTSSEE